MKKVALQVILIISFFVFTSYQAQQNEDKIYWTSEGKLTWDDFKGKPDVKSKHGAYTYSGIDYTVYTKKDTGVIEVKSIFYCNTSWVNKALLISDTLLKHEQCHFDITELYSRKFRKQISSYKFEKKTLTVTLKKLFNSLRKEHEEYQALFDKETNHSKLIEKEVKWEKEVNKSLNKLSGFSGTIRVQIQ